MFGWFRIQSPLTAQQRCWIDERFAWLRQQFGEGPLRKEIVTPTHEFFPDPYAATPRDAEILLDRLCTYMDVDRSRVTLQLFTDSSADEVVNAFNPVHRREHALGMFEAEGGRIRIWLEATRLSEPYSVVSTLAHELGHVHLLADARCDASMADHEPLTDLLTVYFGLGIFTANQALREVNWRSGTFEGWSTAKQGYMSIPEFSYALALYAQFRGEERPRWVRYLRPDARAYFKVESKGIIASSPSASAIATGIEELHVMPAASQWMGTRTSHDDHVDDSKPGCSEEHGLEPADLEFEFDLNADGFFAEACSYVAHGKHDLAIASCSRTLELNPDDYEARLQRVRLS